MIEDRPKQEKNIVYEFTEIPTKPPEISHIQSAQKLSDEVSRKLEFMANATKDYMSFINRSYRYEAANKTHRERFAALDIEVIGKSVEEIWGKKIFQNTIKRFLDKCFAGNQVHYETWTKFPVGGWGYYDVTFYPYYNDEGEITHAVVVSHDITERQRAQEALRESEERYRLLFSHATDGISVVDQTSERILAVNEAWKNMYGYSEEDIKNISSWDIAAEPDEIEASMKDAFKKGSGYVAKRFHRKKDGTVFPVEISGARFKLGEQKNLIVIARDITERERAERELKKAHDELECRVQIRTAELRKANKALEQKILEIQLAEKALKESEERFRTLVETMNEGLGVLDEKAIFTYVNVSLCKMMGRQREEFLGRKITDFLDETNRKILKSYADNIKRGDVISCELEWIHADGRKIITTVSPRPIYDHGEKIQGSFALITDISKRKQAEEAVRQQKTALEFKTSELLEANTALKVLLRRREEDKKELEENLLAQVKNLLLPHLQRLETGGLPEEHQKVVELIQSRLNQIISPFARNISSSYYGLTPKEIQVASLIRDGWTSKEIAEYLNLSVSTVNFHRNKIRSRLGITNKKSNLSIYLNNNL